MRKSKLVCALTMALTAPALFAGCAVEGKCGLGGCPGDAQITEKVQSLLDEHPDIGTEVNVQTLNHIVYLSGFVAAGRMDGAWLGSVDIAINKAWTARAFDMPTDDLSHFAQSGQQGFGINTTNDSRVVIFGGGIPVKRDGVVIGAVGASGGSVKQDVEVAEAAVAGLTWEKAHDGLLRAQ
jgi:uncharacterized protein GlcG (DUF336 family)